MSDPRQHYHGWVARSYGPRLIIPRQNMFYWRMTGRAWFYYLRKGAVSKSVKFVFSFPMSKPVSRHS